MYFMSVRWNTFYLEYIPVYLLKSTVVVQVLLQRKAVSVNSLQQHVSEVRNTIHIPLCSVVHLPSVCVGNAAGVENGE
jgi:hypothetical protein